MWKTAIAERTNAWPDAGHKANNAAAADQAAALSVMKPCLRSIFIHRGALRATLKAS
jgi:hypothetical protein